MTSPETIPQRRVETEPATARPLIRLEGLRVRRQGFHLDVSKLTIREGEIVAILGKSGCGKSTLLTFLGLLVSEEGELSSADGKAADGGLGISCAKLEFPGFDDGATVYPSSDAQATTRAIERIRREYLGFSLQGGELIPSLTLRENVRLPLELNGAGRDEAEEAAGVVLEELGLSQENQGSVSSELSGGQRQRGVFARAIAHGPEIVLLDEPTSALDELTARSALDLLEKHAQRAGQAVVMVTHDRDLAEHYATRIIEMRARCPEFDALLRSTCAGAGLPKDLVDHGPDLISEEDYATLLARREKLTKKELIGRLVQGTQLVLRRAKARRKGSKIPKSKVIVEAAKAAAAASKRPTRLWGIQGRIWRDHDNPERKTADAAKQEHADPPPSRPRSAHARGGFFLRLGWKDAVGPFFARLAPRFGAQRVQRESTGEKPQRKVQAGFLWQLVVNAAVVTALSVLILILMGMQNGLVSRFRENLLRSPTARELQLTLAGSRNMTAQDLRQVASDHPEIEMVIPVVKGLVGSIRSESFRHDGVTFFGSQPTDPKLTVVYPDLDFSGLGLRSVVLPSSLAEKLGVDVGDSVEIGVTRIEDPRGDTTRDATASVEVLQVVELLDDKTVYIHADLADRMLDFKDGRAVRELGWPAFAREYEPSYAEYLILSRRELSGQEKRAFASRKMTIEEVAPGHASEELLRWLEKPGAPPPLAYRAYVEWNDELLWERRDTNKLEQFLTDSDAIVLPWNAPLDVTVDGDPARLIGLSGRPRWLKGYLPNKKLIAPIGIDEQVLRSNAPEPTEKTVTVACEHGEERLELSMTAFLDPVAAPNAQKVLFAPAELVSHLHLWQAGEVEFAPESGIFVPRQRGRTYFTARAFVSDVFQVPVMHERLMGGFLVTSKQAQVNEMARYIDHLDVLVEILGLVALVVAVLATSQVFTEIVLRKQAVIGILRIMGMPFRGITVMLIVRAVLVSTVALLLSSAIAYAGASAVNAWKGESLCRLEPGMLGIVGGGALLCCLLGTLIPLRLTLNDDPLEALRRSAEQR